MEQTAEQFARAVADRVELTTALIGFGGVVVGAVFVFLAAMVPHYLQERARAKKDEPRKRLLLQLLEDDRFPNRWRTFETLQHVIGADEETTKRLLIEVGARASEDGKKLWGLMKYHPLPGPNS